MKYWETHGRDKDIVFAEHLAPDLFTDRVLKVSTSGGSVRFCEGCDDYFSISISRVDAVEALRELANHIETS